MPNSLHILPEELPLRGGGPLLERLGREDEVGQPRALRALARIVDGGLCHRCGSCIGICPTGVLGLSDTAYPKVQNLSACTDCDLCVKVCPGDEFHFQEAHKNVFGTEGDPKATHGHFIDATVSYGTDPVIRDGSTSGGLVTAILVALLEKGAIDGAVVIVSDESKLWRGKPVIARTKADLLAAMKSKYAISPTNALFSEIKAMPGKYALVGLPCQIHGFVKAAELDARLKERVVLTIGLFCHAAVEHEAYEVIWRSLGTDTSTAVKYISRIGKHPGTPHLLHKNGDMTPVYFSKVKGYRPSSIEMINILYRLYTPARCLTCFDASAEFADIAIGDPWMAPPEDNVDWKDGWSFSLIRTERAKKIIAELEEMQTIRSVHLTRNEALACNTMMSHEKRWRAFRVIETHRRQGKSIPEYRMELPQHPFKHFVKTEIHMLTHIFCFIPRYRAQFLKFILGPGGYFFLWVNHTRRIFRDWRRDTAARVRRNLIGRK